MELKADNFNFSACGKTDNFYIYLLFKDSYKHSKCFIFKILLAIFYKILRVKL